jgi:hypothetical protein
MTSQLQPSDDALLDFLSAYANTTEKAMLDMIRGRDIYKRVAVISEKNSRANFLQIYNLFKMSRFEEAHNTIEERRQKWEVELIRRVQEGIDGIDNAMLRERFARVREETRVPVVLVDVPVKALQPEVQNSTEALWYEEEIPLVRNDDVNLTDEDERPTVQFPLPTRSQIRVQQESFDHEVGRVRVLVHPKWHEFVKRTLSPSAIADIVAGFE